MVAGQLNPSVRFFGVWNDVPFTFELGAGFGGELVPGRIEGEGDFVSDVVEQVDIGRAEVVAKRDGA